MATADLSRESTLPELASWRIGTAQPRRRPAFRPLQSGTVSVHVYREAGEKGSEVTFIGLEHPLFLERCAAATPLTAA